MERTATGAPACTQRQPQRRDRTTEPTPDHCDLLIFALFEKGVVHLCPELSLIGVLVSGDLRGHERDIDIQGQHNRVVVTEAIGRQADAVVDRRL